MNRHLALLSIAVAVAVAALVSGCGGSTRTVSISSSPTPASSTSSPAAPSSSAQASTPAPATTPTSKAPGTSQNGGAAAPASGSSSGPAFARTGGSAQGLGGALAVLHARGFAALDTGQYHNDDTLRVLVGARQGSSDGHAQQAFFFVDGRYLGTDTSQPSAQIQVVGQGDTDVTLAYSLYRAHDSLCCPSGGRATVRYQLDNGRLVPLDPIPSASASAAASRQ